jgi:hypothetical protein
LGAGATTAALTGGDITEAAKQALITYITGLSPAAKQAWTVYRTAQGWDKMNEMQKLQAMQSFYKQMATYA